MIPLRRTGVCRSKITQWSRSETLSLGSWGFALDYAYKMHAVRPPYTQSYRYVVSKRDGSWRVYYECMQPQKQPRGVCSVCRKDVAVRKSGVVYTHNDARTAHTCEGSGMPAYTGDALPFAFDEVNVRVCPMCDATVCIDKSGTIESHDFTDGVECAASGEPA